MVEERNIIVMAISGKSQEKIIIVTKLLYYNIYVIIQP